MAAGDFITPQQTEALNLALYAVWEAGHDGCEFGCTHIEKAKAKIVNDFLRSGRTDNLAVADRAALLWLRRLWADAAVERWG